MVMVLVGYGQGWPRPGRRLIQGPSFHLAVVLPLWIRVEVGPVPCGVAPPEAYQAIG